MERQIIQYSQGNIGAIKFLTSLTLSGNEVVGIIIFSKLEEATSIRGTNIYVLWSDLCGENIEQVATLCKNCPTDILEDACSRQDYSGRELVKPFM